MLPVRKGAFHPSPFGPYGTGVAVPRLVPRSRALNYEECGVRVSVNQLQAALADA